MISLLGTTYSQELRSMAVVIVPALQFKASDIFGTHSRSSNFLFVPRRNSSVKPLITAARGNARTEKAKIRNRRMQKKFNGTPTKPRLSVFCSAKQLYAMLVDDQNKKCLFYANTLQISVCNNPPTTIEAAERVGEELVQACLDLKINEISSYDRNGFVRGERIQAFEIAISRHGFLP